MGRQVALELVGVILYNSGNVGLMVGEVGGRLGLLPMMYG